MADLNETVCHQRVELARKGENPWLICQMPSGWAVMCDKQVQPGYVILLPDPMVGSLNELSGETRAQFLADMALIGDALLAATDAYRINYEILGNSDQALHAHIIPRYQSETDERRPLPIWFYDWHGSPDFMSGEFDELRNRIREEILRVL
ncbi:hypothetical protein MXMO3_00493 [Maritalea myrionectae]|uniref:HIT domain-containing protein n=1 Tax=Maritalea myrionectae TaxID=454601 RepID=A0A2R4MAZ7_9HYPH|nr:hypothetical protein [Maritalea myrionectae]AVX03039.1 hypothetical protein MXMO3_00493 [Maritalea myrionectae]